MDFTVREATDEEIDRLLSRERELFGTEFAMEGRWQLTANPAGRGVMAVAVSPRGELAGTRSIVPWRLRADDNPVTVCQLARSWVDPAFRRRGVSVQIGRGLEDLARERGWPMTFGFPSAASIPGHKRLGRSFEPLWRRRQYVSHPGRVLKAFPSRLDFAAPLVHGLFRKTEVRQDWGFLSPPDYESAADALWERSPARSRVRGSRNGAFVRWRFGPESELPYRVGRYPQSGRPRLLAALRDGPDRAGILDVWGDADEGEAAAAVAGLVRLLARDCAVVQWCPSPVPFWQRVAGRTGLVRRGGDIYIIRVVHRELPEALRDIENYDLSEGDTDHA